MKKKNYFVIFGLLSPIILCICCNFCSIIIKKLDNLWRDQHISSPSIIKINPSKRTAVQLQPNDDNINWLGIRYSNNGQAIDIYDHYDQSEAEHMERINLGELTNYEEKYSFPKGHLPGIITDLPFHMDNTEYLWAGCEKESIFITFKLVGGNSAKYFLWKGNQLIGTFGPIKYYADIYHLHYYQSHIAKIVEDSEFSPNCQYILITSGKRVLLLDTKEKIITTFPMTISQHIDEINNYISELLLLTDNQTNYDSTWSPDSKEVIFGTWNSGYQKYNIETKQREWVIKPIDETGTTLKWSNGGKWISFRTHHTMNILSTDKQYATLEYCDNIQVSTWSPIKEELAFICIQFDQCIENDCEKTIVSLVFWDLSNT